MQQLKEIVENIFRGGIGTTWYANLLDIILLIFMVYGLIIFIRDSKAIQLVKGIFFIIVMYILVNLLNMQASIYIFDLFFDNIFIILIIIFTPEIRKALERVGRNNIAKSGILSSLFNLNEKNENAVKLINSIYHALPDLSEKKIGALIAIENSSNLGETIETGTLIDAIPSEDLIKNIFFKNSPLHDGAMIIRDNKIMAAGCILPLSKKEINSSYGTRHRAAIGLSEEGDTLVLVVSEETGKISMVENGTIKTGLTPIEVKEILTEKIMTNNIKPINHKKEKIKTRKSKNKNLKK